MNNHEGVCIEKIRHSNANGCDSADRFAHYNVNTNIIYPHMAMSTKCLKLKYYYNYE